MMRSQPSCNLLLLANDSPGGRSRPFAQTVHYEGDYQIGHVGHPPPKRTQYVKKGINPEDL